MKWIGITGGLGTGKSTVASIIRGEGYPVLDADKIAHEALEPVSIGYSQVVALFGAEILEDSSDPGEPRIDRSKLGALVFKNKNLLSKLEGIVHPLVAESVQKSQNELMRKGHSVAFYDVPLLFEKKLQSRFFGVILVACSQEKQIENLKKRNSWSLDEIHMRLSHQMPLEEKKPLANWVIENSGSEKDLELLVAQLLSREFAKN